MFAWIAKGGTLNHAQAIDVACVHHEPFWQANFGGQMNGFLTPFGTNTAHHQGRTGRAHGVQIEQVVGGVNVVHQLARAAQFNGVARAL